MSQSKEYIELEALLSFVDSIVTFSDTLFDDERYALLKYYVERWNNALRERDAL